MPGFYVIRAILRHTSKVVHVNSLNPNTKETVKVLPFLLSAYIRKHENTVSNSNKTATKQLPFTIILFPPKLHKTFDCPYKLQTETPYSSELRRLVDVTNDYRWERFLKLACVRMFTLTTPRNLVSRSLTGKKSYSLNVTSIERSYLLI
jgi:hypothetical protein